MTTFDTLSETEIIGRVLDGEVSLFEIIVRRFNPYLYRVGRSYNFSHDDTEDLMQDTFVQAYKSLKSFEGRAQFKTWLIRIMLNNCYHKKEKLSYKNEINADLNEQATPMFSNSNHQTDKIVQQRELRHIIEEALSQIPFDYRVVFSLREVNGLKVAETAELLNMSESNVKARLSRAKAMLRKQIEKSYDPGELYEFNLIYCDRIVKNVMERIKVL
ncbi:MAG TPA: sigma-70 family RNA polymerase sigma factor [Edaphocola sp.]|nr:sigma-70 family RNA polymerase sigma factor [Edaphocola sp.]